MDAASGASGSNWERGGRRGPRPFVIALALILVLVAAAAAGAVWLFTSPGVRVASELHDTSGGDITQAFYNYSTTGDTLTVRFAPETTRDEALRFQCDVAVPLLTREDLNPRIVIQHPGGAYVFDEEPCPSPG